MLRPPSRATNTLPSRSAASSWVSVAACADSTALVRRAEQLEGRPRERALRSGSSERRGDDRTGVVEDDGRLDL